MQPKNLLYSSARMYSCYYFIFGWYKAVFCQKLVLVIFASVDRKIAQLLLTNRPTLVHDDVKISSTQNAMKHSFPCCAVRSYPAIYWPNFPTFTYPSAI